MLYLTCGLVDLIRDWPCSIMECYHLVLYVGFIATWCTFSIYRFVHLVVMCDIGINEIQILVLLVNLLCKVSHGNTRFFNHAMYDKVS